MKLVIKHDFYTALTEQNKVLKYYKDLVLNTNNSIFYNYNNKQFKINEKPVSIKLFPSYFTPTFFYPKELIIKRIPQVKINGYAIVINEKQNVEQFLKNEYRKSFRDNIKRFLNRFETCFNVNYKMFFGDITKDEYTLLMNILQDMLTNRFNQRKDFNKELENWNEYLNSTYSLIKSKKASLFVIYHNQTPVHICINHHFNDILFVSVPSYDIDYAKFALGNLSIYKLLEWSLANNYKLLDMAYGDLEYKRRWSTLIYPFEHHILYKNNLMQIVAAKTEITIINLKNYLKSKNIDNIVKNLKNKLKNKNYSYNELSYNSEPFQISNDYKKIAYQTENTEYHFLNKPIFDFLYKHKVHIDQVNVFEIQVSKAYIVSGKNISEKITFL